VPAFDLGNSIQGENPPYFLDRAIVQVELTGISSFTYRMKSSSGRGPSIAGFQVRTVTGYTFFADSTTNLIDTITLNLNSPTNAVVGNIGSNNRLTITNGGTLNSTFGQIALSTGSSSNVVVVTGTNSQWNNATNLLVGLQGWFNTLQITNGGKASNNLGVIGFGPSASNNVVVVSGTNSAWINRNDLIVGYSGQRNSLLITNWGAVTAAGVTVGFGSSVIANNRLTVSSGGTLRSTNASRTAILDVRLGTNVLNGGIIEADQLVVTNFEGFFEFNGGTLITRGGSINKDNGMNFQVGALPGFPAATWDVRSNANPTLVTGGVFLGCPAANTTLLITNGGTLSSSFLSIGFSPGTSNNTATISGPSSVCTNGGFLTVGNYGPSNTLYITNGGAAYSGIGYIGFNSDADYNKVTVSGSKSLWKNNGELRVGNSGSFNSLLITNGGGVSNTVGWLGYLPGANNNTVTLNGTNSAWNNSGILSIGTSGQSNALFISSGGMTRNSSGFVGYNSDGSRNSVLVSDPGSSWNSDTILAVGNSGPFNSFILTNGGAVTAGDSYVGIGAASTGNSVIVTGTNSTWSAGSTLTIGNSGSSNSVLISQGGVVSNVLGLLGIYPESSGNQATVAGVGSAWLNSDYVIVGWEGPRSALLVTNGGAVFAADMILGEAATSTNNLLLVDGGGFSVTNNTSNGVMEIRRGTNRFDAGFIATDRLVATNSLGRISFNGGMLSARSVAIANGAQFVVGNGSSAASYRMSGLVADTHSFANGLRISANATLAGNGTIGGTLTVASLGTLSPGFSIGKIILNNPPTLQGNVIMEIGKTGTALTNDQIQCLGPLAYGGALTVSHLGPAALAAGDSFQLFNASGYSGGFSPVILPTLPAGLTWTNRLLVNGTLAVVAVAPPSITNFKLSGTNLIFQVTNGVAGGSWNLLTSTNVALPVLNWTTARSGTFDLQGAVNLTNGITVGEPRRFFLIRTP